MVQKLYNSVCMTTFTQFGHICTHSHFASPHPVVSLSSTAEDTFTDLETDNSLTTQVCTILTLLKTYYKCSFNITKSNVVLQIPIQWPCVHSCVGRNRTNSHYNCLLLNELQITTCIGIITLCGTPYTCTCSVVFTQILAIYNVHVLF